MPWEMPWVLSWEYPCEMRWEMPWETRWVMRAGNALCRMVLVFDKMGSIISGALNIYASLEVVFRQIEVGPIVLQLQLFVYPNVKFTVRDGNLKIKHFVPGIDI
eukprot:scaffold44483_cov191-Amphora_coffeaeformis.AAC.3